MIYVLDASAMIAFLRAESGGEMVPQVLRDSAHRCFAQAVNYCGVYYDFWRAVGQAAAAEALIDLQIAGTVRREDLSPSFCEAVAIVKAKHSRV